jgi:UDP-N-acetylmuramate--alanine ligase
VSGYDKTTTVLTRQLEAEGMDIHYEDNIELIDKNAGMVVYTPAIPAEHTEFNYYRDHKFQLLKRSEVLGLITKSNFNICVAGTHGKTTTSAMIAHVLRDSGYGCNAFLGGIANNYNTNFWSSPKNVCVAEADEYDRSFLQLAPDVAVVTSMDADHLDIYGTEEKMQDAFVEFTNRIKTGGLLISKIGLARTGSFIASNKMTYAAADKNADAFATRIRMVNGSYLFDAVIRKRIIKDVQLNMGGMHNIENAIAALAVAMNLEIEEDKLKRAIASFTGVKRRFEYVVKTEQEVMIDDYAHHPEELRALINSARNLFPGKKCTVVFQPHLYSRTHDLAAGFAEVLSLADETILLPIYPARELPMPGVSSRVILDKMTNDKNWLKEKEEMLQWIKENKTELLITSGAGDIDSLVEPIKQIILNR